MPANPVAAYWWRTVPNFGDQLAPLLIERFLGRPAVWSKSRAGSGRLLTVGSIVQHARPGDVIWGSGIHKPGADLPAGWSARELTVLAVRGPRTKSFVESYGGLCPAVYGDPGLFLPQLLPLTAEPTREVAILPHIDDDSGWHLAHRRGLPLINPRWPWERVAREICSTAHLVTSSLHGLIAAEAYGVPVTRAAFIRTPGKFEDYFAGLGREPRRPTPWKTAIEQRPEPLQQSPPLDLLPTLLDWAENRYL